MGANAAACRVNNSAMPLIMVGEWIVGTLYVSQLRLRGAILQ